MCDKSTLNQSGDSSHLSRQPRSELLCGCGRDPLLLSLQRKAGKSGTIQDLALRMKVDAKYSTVENM